jgi:hypothetical protein
MQATYEQWSQGRSHIQWGAIVAGLAVGLAVQMLFTLLGLAIGAWSIDLREAQPTGGIPLATGLWTGVSMLMSAFVGGYVASRLSGSSSRTEGLYHGGVLWGVTSVVFAWLGTTALSFMIGGLFTTVGGGLQMLSQGVGTAVSAVSAKIPGTGITNLTAADLRNQIESVLKATEKAELQPSTMKKEIDKKSARAREGQSVQKVSDSTIGEVRERLVAMDRDAAVNIMVNKLGMSEKQAQEVAQTAIGMVASVKETGKELKEKSMDIGNATMTGVGSAAWWLFVLALLSLGASLTGGALGTGGDMLSRLEGRVYPLEVKPAMSN